MNLVSFLISTGINLLYIPFPDSTSEPAVGRRVGRSEEEALSVFPFNILRNTPACLTRSILFGDNELKVTTIPRGYCSNCCPVKIPRDIKFVLYNKMHAKNGIAISPFRRSGAARRAGVNPHWKTVIFIHGFSELSPGDSGTTIVDAYLSRREDYNVILLDWSNLTSFPWYRTAAQNVKLAGRLLKNFIKLFHQSGEIPVHNVHVIGFSLGCHVASIAGKALTDIRIPRITALDPAYPEFQSPDSGVRLAETDADYVDVIHTDAGVFGIPDPIGHADFYPNGGTALQPGCQPGYLARHQETVEQVLACSHLRAWRLYAESVRNPEAFPATHCSNWSGANSECNFTIDAFMGFGNGRNSTGLFYLRTNLKSPYGLNVQEQIKDADGVLQS